MEERRKITGAYAKEAARAAFRVSPEASRKAAGIAGFYQKLENEQREPEYFGVANPGAPPRRTGITRMDWLPVYWNIGDHGFPDPT